MRSSTLALIGTTAPWRTALARIGVLRLGKSAGSKLCNIVPIVCGSREPCRLGVTSDCTTRRWPDVGSDAVGDEGR